MKAKVWLVVAARRSNYGAINAYGQKRVDALRIVKVSVNKPAVEADSEAIEIEIDFPDDYFDTNHPKVQIGVPARKIDAPITATAQVKPKSPTAAAAILHGNP